jgi:hypothetical protein
MKYFIRFLFVLPAGLFACNQSPSHNQILQNKIDSLELELANTYKPGFGEFMSGIQVHHAKLWFAGQNQNWELADFEINEMKEALSGIQKYCTDRPERKEITMIDPSIDSLSQAIQLKNPGLFNTRFKILTNTCNRCHQATNHQFNVITIPETPPFTNQKFNIENTN